MSHDENVLFAAGEDGALFVFDVRDRDVSKSVGKRLAMVAAPLMSHSEMAPSWVNVQVRDVAKSVGEMWVRLASACSACCLLLTQVGPSRIASLPMPWQPPPPFQPH